MFTLSQINRAEKRLLQMGEKSDTIHVIGSPDTDIIVRDDLPTLEAG